MIRRRLEHHGMEGKNKQGRRSKEQGATLLAFGYDQQFICAVGDEEEWLNNESIMDILDVLDE